MLRGVSFLDSNNINGTDGCALLIQQSECPKGYLGQVTILDVVFDHIGKYNKTALKKQQFLAKTA